MPGLELNSMQDNKGQNQDPLSPVKLDLLKEQASRDNRNRRFIQLGDDTNVRRKKKKKKKKNKN